MVSSDEVKRRLMEEIQVIPELLTPSAILQEEHTLNVSVVLCGENTGITTTCVVICGKNWSSLLSPSSRQ